MIEVLALAGAVTQIAGAVSSAIKAGSDVSDLLPHFGKLAKLDSEIQLAEKGQHKGCMDELRSACQLYGPPGMWDLVVKEQAAARQRHKEALEAQAKARDRLFWGISLTVGVLLFLGGTGAMIWGLNEVVNG
jgi:hypothetical protein